MALGLPVILFTAYVHRDDAPRRSGATPTFTPGGTPSSAHGTMATDRDQGESARDVGGARGSAARGRAGHVRAARRRLHGAARAGHRAGGSLLAAGALGENEKTPRRRLQSPANDSTLGPS